ncbi:MAG TPA: aspartate 1-decarboxylase [bacterium]|nr:aspartate 1-decarboxylase [bacterium]HPN34144.1 aspartate 1-decarboxylase [bacterium]
MLRFMCRAKIHRATVTDTCLDYPGSLTLDKTLMQAADIKPFEQVQVLNINNGYRAETYIIEGAPDSGQVIINGALARWAQKGDLLIIIANALADDRDLEDWRVRVVHVDADNRITGTDHAAE